MAARQGTHSTIHLHALPSCANNSMRRIDLNEFPADEDEGIDLNQFPPDEHEDMDMNQIP